MHKELTAITKKRHQFSPPANQANNQQDYKLPEHSVQERGSTINIF
jgi:hypothetical protein